MKLDGIDACVFDAYGTLFDVHSAVDGWRRELGDRADTVSALWRTKQLEYTWLRSLMGEYADFWQVTGDALGFALETHGLEDPRLRDGLMNAYLSLECYPEVPGVLAELKRSGIGTAILSNGSPDMLSAAVEGAELADDFDALLSVDAVRVYKPHASVYRLAVQHFSLDSKRICFLSSNAWDVAGAAHFGFQVVWVNRFRQVPERLPGRPRAEVESLAGLPRLVR